MLAIQYCARFTPSGVKQRNVFALDMNALFDEFIDDLKDGAATLPAPEVRGVARPVDCLIMPPPPPPSPCTLRTPVPPHPRTSAPHALLWCPKSFGFLALMFCLVFSMCVTNAGACAGHGRTV